MRVSLEAGSVSHEMEAKDVYELIVGQCFEEGIIADVIAQQHSIATSEQIQELLLRADVKQVFEHQWDLNKNGLVRLEPVESAIEAFGKSFSNMNVSADLFLERDIPGDFFPSGTPREVVEQIKPAVLFICRYVSS